VIICPRRLRLRGQICALQALAMENEWLGTSFRGAERLRKYYILKTNSDVG
jgi:hypothetical protein